MNCLFRGWILAYRDIHLGLVIPFQQTQSIRTQSILLLVSLVVTWFIYVPIHELLHVAGCVLTGGTVSELVMGREYGAGLLKNIFPFITPATTRYAGRVTGFEPNGDIGYLVTVLAPYILTLFPGIPLIGKAIRTTRFVYWGPGIVIGLATFYNVTGDFFEIGTIISTRMIDMATGGKVSAGVSAYWSLRSDDLFRLIGEIGTDPAGYGFDTAAGIIPVSLVVVTGLILAILSAGWIYQLGRALSRFPPTCAVSEK